MKTYFKHLLLVAFVSMCTLLAQAQQVSTLYFLENAPMRHIVNPAFQPVSNGYFNFTPLGYMSLWAGNNSLTMSDLIYVDPTTGKTITALHPNGDKTQLLNSFRRNTLIGADASLNILSFGFRVKEQGYFHLSLMQRLEVGGTLPKDLFQFLLGGGMQELTGGINYINLSSFGLQATTYSELALGYSHRIDDQWTVGGKLKFLTGEAFVGMSQSDLGIDASIDQWRLHGQSNLMIGGQIDFQQLPEHLDKDNIQSVDPNALINTSNYLTMIKPSGYGAAVDLGFTYKPIKQLQITAAINDLGFIFWNNARKYTCYIDTTFDGVGEFEYNDYVVNGQFDTDSLLSDVERNAMGILDGMSAQSIGSAFARMLSAKLMVGVDANFCNNKIGLGIVSKTRLFNNRLYEELTLGAAIRPCNWFNLAVSYSLLENGRYSNLGAGLSFMPYDGVNMTLALDYIPTSFVKYEAYPIPYKDKGVNLALGFSIVWGSNRIDKDKDGVWDKIDMCPETPRGVQVDQLGCPIDTDGDGVPDYLDQCAGTSEKAYGLVDEQGCPYDTDEDGIPDYLDDCNNTPKEALGYIDEKGCELDTDGDGIADWKDECPDSKPEMYGHIDEKGCPLDTDGDGVFDYQDLCANTPKEATMIDEFGCEIDTDLDGVPDWRDKCPNTRKEAILHVDNNGCELDTDGDGIPDWKDECPTVVGTKANKGCPELQREVRQLLSKAMQGIEFETGNAVIKPRSYALLNQIAQQFIENTSYQIEVQGHTDNQGSDELNKDLSSQRANAVMEYLVAQGVPAERITAHGYGKDIPIADNRTKEGRAKNRRVEFKITFEQITIEQVLDHADPIPAPETSEGEN